MYLKISIMMIFIFLQSCAPHENTDKTLVSWVKLHDLDMQGGSVLTIQNGEQFDGIIYTNEDGGKWIAGSDNDQRTKMDKGFMIKDSDYTEKMVQLAIVYKSSEIRIYHDGVLQGTYSSKNVDLLSGSTNNVVFGISQVGEEPRISCTIEDARIYDKALSTDELRDLIPNKPSKIKPYAWWDFEGQEIIEQTGRYTYHNLGEDENVKLEDGKLILDEWGYMIAMRDYEPETPKWPENPPKEWLTFHLAHPGPGRAEPGDPNPAYFYKGRYHLHYIYANLYGFAYAHLSSIDMVRWKWHPTVLIPPITGHGMFSGTGFFTKEGQPAMIYHGEGSGKNLVTYALDDNLDSWANPEPVIAKDAAGNPVENIRYWDPDCWLIGDTYYALSGGRDPEMMKSDDLKNWDYLGKVLHDEYPDNLGVSRKEDISCANMFKIGDKWMLLCISHRLGCRYFLGDFKDEKYLPDFHAKMNWRNTDWEDRHSGLVYFAPESMVAEDGRRVMWAWLITDISPTGIQSLPRELELPDDGVLRMKPLRELQILRYDEISKKNTIVKKGNIHSLPEITGDAIEIEVTFKAPLPREFGIDLLSDENKAGGMRITAGTGKETMQIGNIDPPFQLKEGEDLTLRIFIDKNLVEVFANDRQAAAVSHEYIRENPNISLFTKDADLVVEEVKAWKMKSIYN